jgi:hypothetical protein
MKEKIIIFTAGVLLGIVLTVGVLGLISFGGHNKHRDNMYMNRNNRPQISDKQNNRQRNKANRIPKEKSEDKQEKKEGN